MAAAQALEKAYAVKVAKDGDSFVSTGPNGTRWTDDTLAAREMRDDMKKRVEEGF